MTMHAQRSALLSPAQRGPTIGAKPTQLKQELRGMSYAEGAAALAPVQAKTTKPAGVADTSREAAAKSAVGKDAGEGTNDVAADLGMTAQQIERRGWFIGSLAVTGSRVDELRKANSPELAEYLALPAEELFAVALYTTNAAYLMNDVLRGVEKMPALVALCKPYIAPTVRALGRLGDVGKDALTATPSRQTKGAQIVKTHDDELDAKAQAADVGPTSLLGRLKGSTTKKGKAEKKARKRRKLERASKKTAPATYRMQQLDEGYEGVFATYATGATLTENAFMSTSPTRAYGHTNNIEWKINNPVGGKRLTPISAVSTENEVLFAPGAKLTIERIRYAWRTKPPAGEATVGEVSDPKQRFPKSDRSAAAWNDSVNKYWEVELKMVPSSSDEETSEEELEVEAAPPEKAAAKVPRQQRAQK